MRTEERLNVIEIRLAKIETWQKATIVFIPIFIGIIDMLLRTLL
jgi:hypothetical protein